MSTRVPAVCLSLCVLLSGSLSAQKDSVPVQSGSKQALDGGSAAKKELLDQEILVRLLPVSGAGAEIDIQQAERDFRATFSEPAEQPSKKAALVIPLSSYEVKLYVKEFDDLVPSLEKSTPCPPPIACTANGDGTTYEISARRGARIDISIRDAEGAPLNSEQTMVLNWAKSLRRTVAYALAPSSLVSVNQSRVYQNSYLGFSYVIPDRFEVQAATGAQQVSEPPPLQAHEKSKDGKPGGVIVIFLDYRLGRKGVGTPLSYLKKQADFFGRNSSIEVLGDPTVEKFADIAFARIKMRKDSEGSTAVYEAEYVVFRKDFAVTFVFAAPTANELNQLEQTLSTFKLEPL